METDLSQPHVSSAVATGCKLDSLQRSDSLEQLEASCRGLAGIMQEDTSAADNHVQQCTTRTAGQPEATNNRRSQVGDTSPDDIEAAAGTPQSYTGTATENVEQPDRAAQRSVRPGGSRRGTDASITAENAMLRQELVQLRSEHVTTRIQCVLRQQAHAIMCLHAVRGQRCWRDANDNGAELHAPVLFDGIRPSRTDLQWLCRLQQVEAAAARREAHQAALLQRAQVGLHRTLQHFGIQRHDLAPSGVQSTLCF